MCKMPVAAVIAAMMKGMEVCVFHLSETMEFLIVKPNKQENSVKSFQIKKPGAEAGLSC